MTPADNSRVNAMAIIIDDCHGDEHLSEVDTSEKIDDFWSSDSIDDLEKFMGRFGDDAQLMVLLKKACSHFPVPSICRSDLYEKDIINLLWHVRSSVEKGFDDDTI